MDRTTLHEAQHQPATPYYQQAFAGLEAGHTKESDHLILADYSFSQLTLCK